MKKIVYCISLLAAGFCAGHYTYFHRLDPHLVPLFDTIYLSDTCFIPIPSPSADSVHVAVVQRRLPLVHPIGGPQDRSLTVDSIDACDSHQCALMPSDSTPLPILPVTHFDMAAADSADVLVPIVSKVYADSNFRAVVSGFEARLDSLVVYPRMAAISPRGSRPDKWALGVTAGACLTPRGISPGVTVGLTYTFLSF